MYGIQLKYDPNNPMSSNLLPSAMFKLPTYVPIPKSSLALELFSPGVETKLEEFDMVELVLWPRFQIDSSGSTIVMLLLKPAVLFILPRFMLVLVPLESSISDMKLKEFSLFVELEGMLDPKDARDDPACVIVLPGVEISG